MRKLLFTLGCFLVFFSHAEAGLYIKSAIGMNFFHHQLFDEESEMNPGYYAGGALGYRFAKFFRLEGEFAYRENKETDVPVNIKSWAGFGNLFLDIPCYQYLFPYIGFGLGYQYTRFTYGDHGVQLEDEVFVIHRLISIRGMEAQGLAGIGIPLLSCASIHCDYRYVGRNKNFVNHTLALSLLIGF